MSEDSPQFDPQASLQAYRQRSEAFVRARLEAQEQMINTPWLKHELEIDAPDLLGLRGHVQETGPWDVIPGSPTDPSDQWYTTWNQALTLNSAEFPDPALFQDFPEELRESTSRILFELANHPLRPGEAPPGSDHRLDGDDIDAAIDPLREAVDCLREPVRSVAINCLYLHDASLEETARVFGLSVETVQFMIDTAFDYLRARFTPPPEGFPKL